eukprot:TRINITY_DN9360_c0_g1_i1.p1 TRINITY_DN9360_c0_g1~~TRINITY_DN9360_c0_g1_i1.p1  ORF type:complete len:1536 (+),score=403.05 TRINITY_DN9360_c0_g1_i1:98-4705(+)
MYGRGRSRDGTPYTAAFSRDGSASLSPKKSPRRGILEYARQHQDQQQARYPSSSILQRVRDATRAAEREAEAEARAMGAAGPPVRAASQESRDPHPSFAADLPVQYDYAGNAIPLQVSAGDVAQQQQQLQAALSRADRAEARLQELSAQASRMEALLKEQVDKAEHAGREQVEKADRQVKELMERVSAAADQRAAAAEALLAEARSPEAAAAAPTGAESSQAPPGPEMVQLLTMCQSLEAQRASLEEQLGELRREVDSRARTAEQQRDAALQKQEETMQSTNARITAAEQSREMATKLHAEQLSKAEARLVAAEALRDAALKSEHEERRDGADRVARLEEQRERMLAKLTEVEKAKAADAKQQTQDLAAMEARLRAAEEKREDLLKQLIAAQRTPQAVAPAPPPALLEATALHKGSEEANEQLRLVHAQLALVEQQRDSALDRQRELERQLDSARQEVAARVALAEQQRDVALERIALAEQQREAALERQREAEVRLATERTKAKPEMPAMPEQSTMPSTVVAKGDDTAVDIDALLTELCETTPGRPAAHEQSSRSKQTKPSVSGEAFEEVLAALKKLISKSTHDLVTAHRHEVASAAQAAHSDKPGLTLRFDSSAAAVTTTESAGTQTQQPDQSLPKTQGKEAQENVPLPSNLPDSDREGRQVTIGLPVDPRVQAPPPKKEDPAEAQCKVPPSNLSLAAMVAATEDKSPPSLPDERRHLQLSWVWQESSASSKHKVDLNAITAARKREAYVETVWPEAAGVCLLWDICGALLVLHEVILVPLLVFKPPSAWASSPILTVMPLFFCMDIVRSFYRGFLKRGVDEVEAWQVVAHYCGSPRLAFDVVMIVLDVLVVFTSRGQAVANFTHKAMLMVLPAWLDWAILFRGLRLLRILRVQPRLRFLCKVVAGRLRLRAEVAELLSCMLEPAIAVLLVVHYLACGFYAMARQSYDRGEASNWLSAHAQAPFAGDVLPIERLYMLSLQWAVSALTALGSVDASPETVSERLYANCAAVFGLVVLAWALGSLMLAMVRLTVMRNMRVYLETRGVDYDLQLRVLKWLQYRTKSIEIATGGTSHARSPEWSPDQASEVLDKLPAALHNELDDVVYGAALVDHPLFAWLQNLDIAPGLHRCWRELSLAPGEPLFAVGDIGSQAYVVLSGELRYDAEHLHPVRRPVGSLPHVSPLAEKPEFLQKCCWLGEPALWLSNWRRRGNATAGLANWSRTELLVLPTVLFEDLLLEPQLRAARQGASNYARAYLRYARDPAHRLTDVLRSRALHSIYKDAVDDDDVVTRMSPITMSTPLHSPQRRMVTSTAIKVNGKVVHGKVRWDDHAVAKSAKKRTQERKKQPLSDSREAIERKALTAGAAVRVHGLTFASNLNGMLGVCDRWDEVQARWIVQLEGNPNKTALKPENLHLVQKAEAETPEKAPASDLPGAVPPGELTPGDKVRVQGLRAAALFDDDGGICEFWDDEQGRKVVRLRSREDFHTVKASEDGAAQPQPLDEGGAACSSSAAAAAVDDAHVPPAGNSGAATSAA